MQKREIDSIFITHENSFIHNHRIGLTAVNAKNDATKCADMGRQRGRRGRYVIYMLVINIDLIMHYFNFVNDSKASLLTCRYCRYEPTFMFYTERTLVTLKDHPTATFTHIFVDHRLLV